MSITFPTKRHFFRSTPKIFVLGTVLLGLLTIIIYSQRTYLYTQIHTHAYTSVEKKLGTEKISPAQQAIIMAIAQEMGISQPIIIRKMNSHALLQFGYHNAFVIFPFVMGCIPIGTTPFLFVSEGFLGDLSVQEQRFLIGHEMVHIKERHARMLQLCSYLLFFALICTGFFIQKWISSLIKKYVTHYQKLFLSASFVFLLGICFLIPKLGEAYYRKSIEREADYQALSRLQAHDGCMSLLNRWQYEWGVPLHNPYYGLFADHPSTHERRLYCLALKNNKGLLS